MSTEGGLHCAIERGAAIGCTTIQLFTKSNRQWQAKALTQEEISLFTKAHKTFPAISPIITHAAYLINLASDKEYVRKQSIESLKNELLRCEQLAIPYLVLHPGSHGDLSENEGIRHITKGLEWVIESTQGKIIIALETMAKQGTSLGGTFDQLAEIREQCSQKKQIKICLDTCHVFAAGYDITNKIAYESLWNNFDKIIGLSQLAIIHVNDSKKDCNSHVDRHENIGEGKIGNSFFKLLCNDERFFDIPKILETPKTNLDDDLKNISALKQLLTKETKKILNAH